MKTIEHESDNLGNWWAYDVTLINIHVRSLFMSSFHSNLIKKYPKNAFEPHFEIRILVF